MIAVTFSECRARLSELLDQVGRGKKLLITRRGKPAALLVPPPPEAPMDVRQVIAELKALRRGNNLGKSLSIRSLIEEGRRS